MILINTIIVKPTLKIIDNIFYYLQLFIKFILKKFINFSILKESELVLKILIFLKRKPNKYDLISRFKKKIYLKAFFIIFPIIINLLLKFFIKNIPYFDILPNVSDYFDILYYTIYFSYLILTLIVKFLKHFLRPKPNEPCEGDDCEEPCEGDECEEPCEGDDCEKPEEPCEGDDCEKPQEPCEGDDCEKPQEPCEGDDCEKPQEPCEGDDCEKPNDEKPNDEKPNDENPNGENPNGENPNEPNPNGENPNTNPNETNPNEPNPNEPNPNTNPNEPNPNTNPNEPNPNTNPNEPNPNTNPNEPNPGLNPNEEIPNLNSEISELGVSSKALEGADEGFLTSVRSFGKGTKRVGGKLLRKAGIGLAVLSYGLDVADDIDKDKGNGVKMAKDIAIDTVGNLAMYGAAELAAPIGSVVGTFVGAAAGVALCTALLFIPGGAFIDELCGPAIVSFMSSLGSVAGGFLAGAGAAIIVGTLKDELKEGWKGVKHFEDDVVNNFKNTIHEVEDVLEGIDDAVEDFIKKTPQQIHTWEGESIRWLANESHKGGFTGALATGGLAIDEFISRCDAGEFDNNTSYQEYKNNCQSGVDFSCSFCPMIANNRIQNLNNKQENHQDWADNNYMGKCVSSVSGVPSAPLGCQCHSTVAGCELQHDCQWCDGRCKSTEECVDEIPVVGPIAKPIVHFVEHPIDTLEKGFRSLFP